MKHKTIESYVAAKIRDARKKLRKQLCNQYLKEKGAKKQKVRQRLRQEYIESEEFKNLLEESVKKTEEYQMSIDSEIAKKNYEQYVQRCLLQEEKERERQRLIEERNRIIALKTQELENLLKQEAVAEMIHDICENMYHDKLETMRDEILNDKLVIHGGSWYSKQYYDTELDALREKYFFDEYRNQEIDWILTSNIICQKVCESLEKEEAYKQIIANDFEDDAFEIIDETIEEEAMNVSNRLYDDFSDEKMVLLLKLNPHYKDKLAEKEYREKHLVNNILTSIPAQMKDLYPLARGMHRHFILHIGPTNSGKTYDALQAFQKAKVGVYLAPLRLLAYEIYDRTINNGIACNMITGEEKIYHEGATHICQTIETVSLRDKYDVVVIDEGQMIFDNQRGGAWTQAIMGVLANEIHICASPDALDRLVELIEYCQDSYDIIHKERMTPLIFEDGDFQFPQDIQKGDAFIVFSRKSCILCAAELEAAGIRCSVVYGSLPYQARHKETASFACGETDVLVATDAIGMGLNLPIRRIVFLETRKYDGKRLRTLRSEEIKQIAGRAGRKGLYDVGYVHFYERFEKMKSILENQSTNEKIRLNFPSELIHIEGRLSDIYDKWQSIEVEDLFCHIDITKEQYLCKKLEAISNNKELIYSFVTIPFQYNHPVLYSIWFHVFLDVDKGKQVTLKTLMDYEEWFKESIDDHLQYLEASFQRKDLMHYCIDRFGDESCKDEDKQKLQDLKQKISDEIVGLLKHKHFTTKKCSICHKPLPWNYPYGLCFDCYEKEYV